jgi:hypothetical protein
LGQERKWALLFDDLVGAGEHGHGTSRARVLRF